MTRRRYVQLKDGELLEVSADFQAEQREARHYVVGDRHYDGLTSPVDGADISTRTKHREYMRRNNLTTADDFKGSWDAAAKARADFYQGRDSSRKSDVVEAVHQLQQGKKPPHAGKYGRHED
jgi:hypothetical protein